MLQSQQCWFAEMGESVKYKNFIETNNAVQNLLHAMKMKIIK